MELHKKGRKTESEEAAEETVMYSGTWTLDEQLYVKGICGEFEAGNIPEAKDGVTLRLFIATKLGCQEKRVSKKYERSGYNGRQSYRSGIQPMSPEESRMRQEKLAKLEENFRESREKLLWARPVKRPRVQASSTTKKKTQNKSHRATPKAPPNSAGLAQQQLAFALPSFGDQAAAPNVNNSWDQPQSVPTANAAAAILSQLLLAPGQTLPTADLYNGQQPQQQQQPTLGAPVTAVAPVSSYSAPPAHALPASTNSFAACFNTTAGTGASEPVKHNSAAVSGHTFTGVSKLLSATLPSSVGPPVPGDNASAITNQLVSAFNPSTSPGTTMAPQLLSTLKPAVLSTMTQAPAPPAPQATATTVSGGSSAPRSFQQCMTNHAATGGAQLQPTLNVANNVTTTTLLPAIGGAPSSYGAAANNSNDVAWLLSNALNTTAATSAVAAAAPAALGGRVPTAAQPAPAPPAMTANDFVAMALSLLNSGPITPSPATSAPPSVAAVAPAALGGHVPTAPQLAPATDNDVVAMVLSLLNSSTTPSSAKSAPPSAAMAPPAPPPTPSSSAGTDLAQLLSSMLNNQAHPSGSPSPANHPPRYS